MPTDRAPRAPKPVRALTSPKMHWAVGYLRDADDEDGPALPGILLRWPNTKQGRDHADAALALLKAHGFWEHRNAD